MHLVHRLRGEDEASAGDLAGGDTSAAGSHALDGSPELCDFSKASSMSILLTSGGSQLQDDRCGDDLTAAFDVP
jgi:hypothetical protein